MIGIYQIKNIVNGHLYIGKSEDIDRRWKEHTRQLNQSKHHNAKLQSDWDKFGAENFEFKVLKECSKEELGFEELENIWAYDYIFNLYNPLSYKDKVIFTLANWLKSIGAGTKVDQRVKIGDKYFKFNLAAEINGKLVYVLLQNSAYNTGNCHNQQKKRDYIASNMGYNRKIIECDYYPYSSFDVWEWAYLDDIKKFILAA